MNRFSRLYEALDATTRTGEKLDALVRYFEEAAPSDAAWAVFFLSGRRLKRLISSGILRKAARAVVDLPEWLLEECYGAVGDSAETAALLLPAPTRSDPRPLHDWIERHVLPLRGADEQRKIDFLRDAWTQLDGTERFVFNKLLTGAFRVGVSQRLLTRALARASGLDAAVIAHRLMGAWNPSPGFFARLMGPDTGAADLAKPYPFYLAYPLDQDPEALGPVADWQAEWKWDGIRAQVIRRGDEFSIWSRGEEMVAGQFPELVEAGGWLPDGTVLDGEIVAWKEAILPFAELQRRLGRKTLSRRMLAEVPVAFIAYDLLEQDGRDMRALPLRERRATLEAVLASLRDPRFRVSPLVPAESWEALALARARSRDEGVEGLMLKRRDGPYEVGRKRAGWWKWKVDPYTVDAVLIYAQRGSGRRAGLYTDYSFGVWSGGELVKFAEAYSGLTDAEILEVDRFIRRNTTERFGPVRAVRAALVFEIAFEDIRLSPRHKSGIAVRFPRIARWRRDKPIEEADTIETVRAMVKGKGKGLEV